MSELKIMSHLGPHLNIVNLLGACTKHGEHASQWQTVENLFDTHACLLILALFNAKGTG